MIQHRMFTADARHDSLRRRHKVIETAFIRGRVDHHQYNRLQAMLGAQWQRWITREAKREQRAQWKRYQAQRTPSEPQANVIKDRAKQVIRQAAATGYRRHYHSHPLRTAGFYATAAARMAWKHADDAAHDTFVSTNGKEWHLDHLQRAQAALQRAYSHLDDAEEISAAQAAARLSDIQATTTGAAPAARLTARQIS